MADSLSIKISPSTDSKIALSIRKLFLLALNNSLVIVTFSLYTLCFFEGGAANGVVFGIGILLTGLDISTDFDGTKAEVSKISE